MKINLEILKEYIKIEKLKKKNYKYIFTRSSFNAIDVSFRICLDFNLNNVNEYLYKRDLKIIVFLIIGMVNSGPPLGTLLSQYGIDIVLFCKKFNKYTENIKKGLRVKVLIFWNLQKNLLDFKILKFPISFLLNFLIKKDYIYYSFLLKIFIFLKKNKYFFVKYSKEIFGTLLSKNIKIYLK